MSFRVFEAEYKGRKFKIEEDFPEVGVYLYIYENERCTKDYLQNDIKTCKVIAFEGFGVPICCWVEKLDNVSPTSPTTPRL